MNTKLIFLSLLAVSILQGSEYNSSDFLNNPLGVYDPGSSKPLISVVPWDGVTYQEMSRMVQFSFINQKQFPVGNSVYVIDEIDNGFNVERMKYNQQLKKYEDPEKVEHKSLDLDLRDCSFVVYNGGNGLGYSSLSLAADLINTLDAKKIRCVINHPTDKRAEIASLIRDKKVYSFSSLDDVKAQFVICGCVLGLLSLVWQIKFFNSFVV